MTIEPDVPAELLSKAQAYTDTAIISICRYSGEGWDRKSVIDPNNKALWDYEREMTEKSAELFKDGDFCLSVKEKEMIDTVKASFKNVIVILNVGGMVDTSWFAYDDQIQSALLALQGGIEGGLAAAELLVGMAILPENCRYICQITRRLSVYLQFPRVKRLCGLYR